METVSFNAALASCASASALVRALQTTNSTRDIVLPHAEGSDWELDVKGFELRGLAHRLYGDSGLDRFDSESGEIPHPQPIPAGWIVDELGLTTDKLQRTWLTADNDIAFRSRVWGCHRPPADEWGHEQRHGSLLHASIPALRALMERTGSELVFYVSIARPVPRSERTDRLGEYGYLNPYVRVFRMDGLGEIHGS